MNPIFDIPLHKLCLYSNLSSTRELQQSVQATSDACTWMGDPRRYVRSRETIRDYLLSRDDLIPYVLCTWYIRVEYLHAELLIVSLGLSNQNP